MSLSGVLKARPYGVGGLPFSSGPGARAGLLTHKPSVRFSPTSPLPNKWSGKGDSNRDGGLRQGRRLFGSGPGKAQG